LFPAYTAQDYGNNLMPWIQDYGLRHQFDPIFVGNPHLGIPYHGKFNPQIIDKLPQVAGVRRCIEINNMQPLIPVLIIIIVKHLGIGPAIPTIRIEETQHDRLITEVLQTDGPTINILGMKDRSGISYLKPVLPFIGSAARREKQQNKKDGKYYSFNDKLPRLYISPEVTTPWRIYKVCGAFCDLPRSLLWVTTIKVIPSSL